MAWATAFGYAVFSIAMLAVATPRLAGAGRERATLWIGTLAPFAWSAGLLWLLTRSVDATPTGIALRILVFLAAYAPVGLACAGVPLRRRA